jgi:prevent-host-death family protein
MNVIVTRSELEERLGDALDQSLTQPLIVTKHGRPKNVLLSYDEYQRLLARDRRIVRLEDWTTEDLAALEASEMEPGHEHLNAETDKA